MAKYENLVNDLKIALEEARKVAEAVQDGGTCNFDSMMLSIGNRRNEKVIKEIETAAKEAGTRCWYNSDWKAMIFSVPCGGQADKRTAQAETMERVMREKGYPVSVYYQMD